MRHLFVAFMIALLPLRGWVGDAMAAQMTNAALAQTGVASHHAMHDAPVDMALHADCAGHHDSHTDDHQASSQGDCGTCTACQICHSVALTLPVPQHAPGHPSSVQPQTAHPQFTSVERAPGVKPPIL